MKIPPVEADIYADRQTDKYDEVNSRFRNFANAPTNAVPTIQYHMDTQLPAGKLSSGGW